MCGDTGLSLIRVSLLGVSGIIRGCPNKKRVQFKWLRKRGRSVVSDASHKWRAIFQVVTNTG